MSYYQLNPQEFQALQTRFQQVDRDRSGAISWDELQLALRQRGENFREDTCKLMVRMFDRTGQGSINFNEFIELNRYMMTMRRAFQQLDADRSGTLDAGEIIRALQTGGYHLSQNTFNQLWRTFDTQQRGYLTFDQYMDLSLFLGIAKNLFNWQDTNHSGNITVNFDTLAMMGSMMR